MVLVSPSVLEAINALQPPHMFVFSERILTSQFRQQSEFRYTQLVPFRVTGHIFMLFLLEKVCKSKIGTESIEINLLVIL